MIPAQERFLSPLLSLLLLLIGLSLVIAAVTANLEKVAASILALNWMLGQSSVLTVGPIARLEEQIAVSSFTARRLGLGDKT